MSKNLQRRRARRVSIGQAWNLITRRAQTLSLSLSLSVSSCKKHFEQELHRRELEIIRRELRCYKEEARLESLHLAFIPNFFVAESIPANLRPDADKCSPTYGSADSSESRVLPRGMSVLVCRALKDAFPSSGPQTSTTYMLPRAPSPGSNFRIHDSWRSLSRLGQKLPSLSCARLRRNAVLGT